VPVSALRRAIQLTEAGSIVGMFPEGGCRRGKELVFRGGRIKQGICTVAMRAQVAIQPLVVLGTHQLNAFEAWLPGAQTKIWCAFGDVIEPPPPRPARRDWRQCRSRLAEELEAEFVRTYHELLAHSNLRDKMTP
jgi:1-acyl-sn-glycerol-3-phosphate acyltransferase